MAKKQLTQRQLEVLEWISRGCPDKGWPDSYYKQSARMMEAYDLVKISGHGPTWTACITDQGRDQLAHGAEVTVGNSQKTGSHSATSTSRGKKVAVNRQTAVVPVPEKTAPAPVPAPESAPQVPDDDVRELYDLLVADEFHILVELPADSSDVDWKARARRLAKAEHLLGSDRVTISRHRGGSWNDYCETISVALVPKDRWLTRTPQEVVDATRVKYHPAVATVVEGSRGFSTATVTRAKRVLHAMFTEAEARGWKVTIGEPERRGAIDYKAATTLRKQRRTVRIVTNAESHEIQAYEKHRRREQEPSKEDLEHEKRWGYYSHTYEYLPTGRLIITRPHSVIAQDSESGRLTVENRLPTVFAEWAAKEPWAKRKLVLGQRREAEHARRRAEVEPAADLIHADNVRREVMRERAEEYRRFLDVQTYVEALLQAQQDGRIELGSEAEEWVNWCLAHRFDGDPVKRLRMPQIPAQNSWEREQLVERLIARMGPMPGD